MVDFLQLRTRRIAARGVAAILIVIMTACTGGAEPARPSDGGGSAVDAGPGEEREEPDTVSRVKELTIVSEPDTLCAAAAGNPRLVYPSTNRIWFTDLGRVAGRWLASGIGDEGFVTFDSDGANASPSPVTGGSLNRAAGSPTNVLRASSGTAGITAARFDPAGRALGSASALSPDQGLGLALGRDGERALVTWSTGSNVRARVVDGAGAAEGEAFDLETEVAHDSFAAAIAPHDGSDFALAWSDHRHAGDSWRVYFAFAKAGAISGLAHNLFGGATPLAIVKLVKTPTGYALLLNYDLSVSRAETLVVPLNPLGQLAGPAHRLEGATYAYGIAAQGRGLGIVARKADGADAFRPLDASGAPVGPWVCLDSPALNRDQSASVETDGAGYAALYLAPDGATYFTRFDTLGTGNP